METSERKVLERLRHDAEEAEALFSNARQEQQERTVVAGLLRVLGVEFREDQIVKCDSELRWNGQTKSHGFCGFGREM